MCLRYRLRQRLSRRYNCRQPARHLPYLRSCSNGHDHRRPGSTTYTLHIDWTRNYTVTTLYKLLPFTPLLFPSLVLAQSRAFSDLPINVRFAATRANAPPGTCGCFFLVGGAADAAFRVLPGVSVAVEVGGNTVGHVAGTARGLSTITLLAGPRYTVPVGRLALSGQAMFGAARGLDADFSTGTRRTDTATAFGMALGGFAEVHFSHAVSLRVAQVDYVQTNLPNGIDNRQRNIRVGAGVTFRVPLPTSRR